MTFYNRILLVATAVYVVVLLVLAYMPQGTVPVDLWTGVGDKISHVLAFGILTLLLLEGLAAQRGRWWVLLTMTIVLGFGGFIELTQPFFGRSCSLYEWLASVLGFVLALGAWAAVRAVIRRRRANAALAVLKRQSS